MKVLVCVIILPLLIACTPIDRCTTDPNLADCRAQGAVANATITAVNAEAEARARQSQMRATQDAVALQAQATQGAINSRATQAAVEMQATAGAREVNAKATRSAIEIEALKQAMVVSATQSAIAINAFKQQTVAEATRMSLESQIKVDQATAQASASSAREWLWIGLVIIVVTTISLSFAWYGRKAIQAVQHGVLIKSAFRVYGPNNSRAVLLMPGPKGAVHATPIDDIIGEYLLSDGSQSTLQRLDVPDREKLAAFVEQAKRRKLVELAAASGAWPEISGGSADESSRSLPAAAATNYPYTIATVSPTLPSVAGWLDEVEPKLLATGG